MDKRYKSYKKLVIDYSLIRYLISRFRDHIVSLLIIFVSFFLFIFIIIPQIQTFLELRNQEQDNQKKMGVLKNNLEFYSNLSDPKLDSELSIVTSALPIDKDFTAILQTLSFSSSKAGVTLGDFDLKIGELSTQAAQVVKRPSITITLNIGADAFSAQRFIRELTKNLPLSEVTNIQVSAKQTAMSVVFYYKPFSQVIFKSEVPVETRSKRDATVINRISSWYSANTSFVSEGTSTSSSEFIE